SEERYHHRGATHRRDAQENDVAWVESVAPEVVGSPERTEQADNGDQTYSGQERQNEPRWRPGWQGGRSQHQARPALLAVVETLRRFCSTPWAVHITHSNRSANT